MKLNVRLTPYPARRVWRSRWLTWGDVWLEARIRYHLVMSAILGVLLALQKLMEWQQTDHVLLAVKLARKRRPMVALMIQERANRRP